MKLPPTFDKKDDAIFAVIETPQGSRNKYDFVPDKKFFQLDKTLPAGVVFPLDFGFIPGTLGEDGDPLDILVINDAPAAIGVVVKCRIIGVIEAEQTEREQKGKPKPKKVRNDRFIGVLCNAKDCAHIKHIGDVNSSLINELTHFFQYYNDMSGKKFELLGTHGPDRALKLIRKAMV